MRSALASLLLPLLTLLGCGPAEGPALPASSGDAATLAFTDITAEAGLADFRHANGAVGQYWFPETMGSGGGFLDYDGDGRLDVLLVGGGTWAANDADVRKLWLYRNTGDGRFALAEDAGLEGLDGYGFGVTVADYDNDGDDDVFFTTLGPNHLLRNDGGRFTDVTANAGIDGPDRWSGPALFFDADRDGHVDLYVGDYVDWTPETDIFCSQDGENKGYCTPELYEGMRGTFYHNRGDGTFADWTERAGFTEAPGKTLGVAELDFNRDGWPDLVVANDTDPDLLYQNRGDGTFDEIGVQSGIAFDERGRARAGMGIDVGVLDPSGEPTVVVGNFSNEMIGVYRHLGGGVFLDRAAASKLGRPSLLTLTFGLFLFDADLDGDLDLFAANGHVQPQIERVKDNITFRQPPHLFLNDGTGTFEDAAPVLGGVFTTPLLARGAAYGDVDGDGDLDILVTENEGGAHLWRNDLAAQPALRVTLEGRASNRDGVGARIVAVIGGQRQERRVRTGGSFLSASEKTATFGLGGAARVDSLTVFWPSGTIDRRADLAPGAIRLVEGATEASAEGAADAP